MAKEKTISRRIAGNVDNEHTTNRSSEETVETINPKTGEDPGLLPTTEDPRERRLKRNTM